ncbi:MAG TPA: hypothetical protein PLE99_03150 [Candidatus Thiothrix moscowensis]|uniref:hypothetical protein n=1 Tax=unclassified Thiothrix TaxID=2636184 RepID=UPI0025E70324|nr:MULTISPECIES: hypothetical protein [unclassified Thiothrix]HRJ51740.1 hypothetical protein [Candidatus Thiothrix moscowensis]HRJ92055.1 hypothetical protein [Candidatus Thiothrix moscowensis]
MNSLQHLLLSTLLVLVVYLIIQNQQLHASLQHGQQATTTTLATTLEPLAEKLDAINTVTTKLGKEADDAANQKLTALQKRLSLYKTLSIVNQAERLRAEGKGTEAAEKLVSTKKTIWETGETFTAHKARLQGLMGPIDKLTGAWKSGDTSTNVDAVRKELDAVLGELNNDAEK